MSIEKLKKHSKWVSYVLIFLISAIPLIAGKAPEKALDLADLDAWQKVCRFLSNWSVEISLGLGALLLGARLLQDINPRANQIRTKKFLDLLQERHFSRDTGEVDDSYRATVFVPRKVKKEQFLCVYARSGFEHQSSETKWNITESEKGNHDGVAGVAWVKLGVIPIDDLPNVDSSNCSDSEKNDYCSRTFVDRKRLESLSWRARSFRAINVQNSKGVRVAVLMLESKNPDGLKYFDYRKMQIETKIYSEFVVGATT